MRADLHLYTNFSKNGVLSPEEVVDMALSKGLSYIAITDHNTIKGAEQAKKYAEGKNITVLIGEEIDCKEGTVIGINLKRGITKGLSIYDVVRLIHDQGGYAIALYPFLSNIGIKSFTMDFDAVEYATGTRLKNPAEEITKRYGKKFDMPMIVSSGAYFSKDIGICGIEFSGDIFESLVSGDFKIFGKRISFTRALSLKIDTLKSKINSKLTNRIKLKSKKKSNKKEMEERF